VYIPDGSAGSEVGTVGILAGVAAPVAEHADKVRIAKMNVATTEIILFMG
jgi:hypothetical protein